MAPLVWFTMGVALWHFTVFVPDRFRGGIVGAFIGGFVASLVGISTSNLLMQVIVAFVGAVILLIILKAVGLGRHRTTV
jgi:uncharacterized membrane protein YjjP (DUF1212 family)